MSNSTFPPETKDVDKGPALEAVTLALLVISTLCIAIRCYVRLCMSKSFGWDDGFIIAAMVSELAYLSPNVFFFFKKVKKGAVTIGNRRFFHFPRDPQRVRKTCRVPCGSATPAAHGAQMDHVLRDGQRARSAVDQDFHQYLHSTHQHRPAVKVGNMDHHILLGIGNARDDHLAIALLHSSSKALGTGNRRRLLARRSRL